MLDFILILMCKKCVETDVQTGESPQVLLHTQPQIRQRLKQNIGCWIYFRLIPHSVITTFDSERFVLPRVNAHMCESSLSECNENITEATMMCAFMWTKCTLFMHLINTNRHTYWLICTKATKPGGVTYPPRLVHPLSCEFTLKKKKS